jgi:riboflavin transporter FmnP
MLSAVAFVLMFLDFPIPFLIPSFVKMDFSELPALLAAFSLGPVYGVVVCLVKNLIHLTITTTGGAGEICNFLLGSCFVFPAGLIYQQFKSRRGALVGTLVGAAVMAVLSVPLNYYISYPVYAKFMPIESIIAMYQALRPSVNGLLECLIIFNAPFTLVKGLLTSAFCFLVYKPLSPILHGRR